MEKRRHIFTDILFCILKCTVYFAIWFATQYLGVYITFFALAIKFRGSSAKAIARLTNAYSVHSLVIANALMVLVFALVYKIIKKPLQERCDIKPKPLGTILRVIVLGIIAQLAVQYILSAFIDKIPASWIKALEKNNASLTCAPESIVFISTVILAPIAEEILMRGLVLRSIRKATNTWTAIILSSVIFGLLHGNPIGIIYAASLGVLLGWVSVKLDSILPTIIMHMAFNWTSLALSSGSVSIIWALLFQISVPLMVFLIIKFARYKEPAPKNKDDDEV